MKKSIPHANAEATGSFLDTRRQPDYYQRLREIFYGSNRAGGPGWRPKFVFATIFVSSAGQNMALFLESLVSPLPGNVFPWLCVNTRIADMANWNDNP
jgi:hypothetical protein